MTDKELAIKTSTLRTVKNIIRAMCNKDLANKIIRQIESEV